MEYQNTAFGQRTGLPKPAGFSKTPPKGARVNDLSGAVPANQIWAKAYNQASGQYGGNTKAQSWTMPGTYTSQGYNPTTGVYSKPTTGESWSGNWAYSPMDSRPGPTTAQATGVGGNQMNWQDALRQRDAFVGNLVNRLNQYNGGQLTGRPTFDTQQLLSQADKQIAEGTWQNPFAAPQAAPAPQPSAAMPPMNSFPPEVQQAIQSAAPFVNTQWQNPFGNAPEANTPRPSWPTLGPQQASSDTAYMARPAGGFVPGVNYNAPWANDPTSQLPDGYKWQKVNEGGRSVGWLPVSGADAPPSEASRQAEEARLRAIESLNAGRAVTPTMGQAQPIAPQDTGTPYSPGSAISTGLRAPGGGEVTPPGWSTKPPSQWSDADWAEYETPYKTGPLRDLVHTPKYYRDDQGRARYYSGAQRPTPGSPLYQDADEAWNRGRMNEQRFRPNSGIVN